MVKGSPHLPRLIRCIIDSIIIEHKHMGLFRKNAPSDGLGEYEEIQEKKTTVIGYFLILLMAIFMIIVGETVFSDLKRIPDQPIAPAYCIAQITGEVYNGKGGYYNGYPSRTSVYIPRIGENYNCTFNDIDKQFELNVLYKEIERPLNTLAEYAKQINTFDQQIQRASYQIQNLESQYNLSLQEKIAGEQVLYNRSNIQGQITGYRNEIAGYERQKAEVVTKRDAEQKKIEPQISELREKYKEATSHYNKQMAWYRFKTFGLMLLFVLPFFLISTNRYFALKRRNSPYTIIATGIMVASSFLFLQIVLTFLYDILPKEWLTAIFELFKQLPFFRYIVYYGSVILVILIFGGIVYIIQRKIFNPKRVAVRRLKDNKCPKCSFSLNQNNDFCPHCGLQLKEACGSCGNKRIANLAYCPTCGKPKGHNAGPSGVEEQNGTTRFAPGTRNMQNGQG
jgi:hypothetical protein